VHTIGPYKILKTIAMGGMGEVYLAALEREGGFEKQVALKCVLPRLMNDVRFLELFEREARLAAVLTHRNIVPVFDFGRDHGRAWLAMEYVHGVDVKAVYDHVAAPLPPGFGLEIAVACARALNYAHRARDTKGRPLNIIHRDVSPQNILLSFEGDVKLADFGLAQATARDTQEEGSLKGKFAYMSPEQAMGRAVDGRSDQFSLAVVLYEMLSGTRAFFTEDGAQTILARVAGGEPLTPLSEVAPTLSPQIVAVVERALSRDRRDRFADAGAFADALQTAAKSSGVTVGYPEVGGWLRETFPDRALSMRARTELTVESTAIAGDPITLDRHHLENTAAADTSVHHDTSVEIGLENTASAEHLRPTPARTNALEETYTAESESESETPPMPITRDKPSSSERNSNTSQLRNTGRRVVYFMATLGLLTFGVWWIRQPTVPQLQSSETIQDTTNASGKSLNVRSEKRAPDPPPIVEDASVTAEPDSAAQRHAAADQHIKVRPAPKQVAAPKKKRRNPARRRAAKTKDQSTREPDSAVLEKAPPIKESPPLKNTVPSAMPPKAEKAPLTSTPLGGHRVRIQGKGATLRGALLKDNWYRISTSPTLGKVVGGPGPKVKMRAVIRGGASWVAFGSTPYGQLFIDGQDMGPTPARDIRLRPGRIEVKVRGDDGQETQFTLHIAD
jgi:serine/threonine protein kinase